MQEQLYGTVRKGSEEMRVDSEKPMARWGKSSICQGVKREKDRTSGGSIHIGHVCAHIQTHEKRRAFSG